MSSTDQSPTTRSTSSPCVPAWPGRFSFCGALRRLAVLMTLMPAGALCLPAAAAAANAPGSLISVQAMPDAPQGAPAFRIVYTSKGLNDEPISVSGVVILPPGPVPHGGRPVVAWAHPTTGIVARCAPSLARVFFASVQGLSAMLARGYVVAATDYPTIGTSAVQPYLVGISEARAVLDSVRAAREVPGSGANSIFAVWGHSQGGHAALFAGLLAKRYAPELHLAGIAAASPPTDLATLTADDLGTGGGNNITAMTLWSWSHIYGAPIEAVVKPQALPAIERLTSLCIERWFDIFTRMGPTAALKREFLKVDNLTEVEPWKRLLAENTPGALQPEIPVFVAQGTADMLVRPAVTAGYVRALCRHGSRVQLDLLANVGHAFAGRDSAEDAVGWIGARFNGDPAPSNCEPSARP